MGYMDATLPAYFSSLVKGVLVAKVGVYIHTI